MKLKDTNFNDEEISIMPTKTVEMGMSANGIKMALKMVTKQVYSNVIGSVVREIASNSVDSHVEAEVDDAIKIKLLYEESGVYCSFQDFGVGMNPERVEMVYGQYFESTKRNNNDEIGGFGIGGKSPMAYANSFFVITISDKVDDVTYSKSVIKNLEKGLKEMIKERENIAPAKSSSYLEHLISLHGTEDDVVKQINSLTKRLKKVEAIKEERIMYQYNIFKGKNAPVIQELGFGGTTDRKGSEVKIPIKKDDIDTFTREIKRQLYYFPNVIFEGWEGSVADDYTVLKGKHFVYRGDDYESSAHVCLGNVAYPLNFNTMNISRYDWDIPVAITLNIGDIEVTPPREELLYSEKTINVIKAKLEEAKKELLAMYAKQVEGIVSLEDYLRYKSSSKAVKLGDDNVDIGSLLDDSFKPKKFKYAELKISDSANLFKIAYEYHKIGMTKRRNSSSAITYDLLVNSNGGGGYYGKKIFYSNTGNITPNNYKKAYIKAELKDCAYGHMVATKRDLKNISEKEKYKMYSSLGIMKYNEWTETIEKWNVEEKKAKRLINKLVKDLVALTEKHLESYEFEATQDFIDKIKASRKRRKPNGDLKLNVRDYASYEYGCEINLSALKGFKGKIFYSTKEDEDYDSSLTHAYKAHSVVFDDKYVFKPNYNVKSDGSFKTKLKANIMFIRVRKNQVSHLEKLSNAYHGKHYYKIMLSRKYDAFVSYFKLQRLNQVISEFPTLFHNENIGTVDANIKDAMDKIYQEIAALKIVAIKKEIFDGWYGVREDKVSETLGLSYGCDAAKVFNSKKEITFLKGITETNKEIINVISIGPRTPLTEKLVMLLDLALER